MTTRWIRKPTRSDLQPGQTMNCGNVGTDGRDHRPIQGEHIATVQAESDEQSVVMLCGCGHRWSVPRVRDEYWALEVP